MFGKHFAGNAWWKLIYSGLALGPRPGDAGMLEMANKNVDELTELHEKQLMSWFLESKG